VISRSNIIAAEQFAQLLLTIPGGLALHFRSILLQLQPAVIGFQAEAQYASNIATILQAPGYLLIAQTTRRTSLALHHRKTLCVYTGAPDKLRGFNFSPHDRFLGEKYLVFELSPVHTVYQMGGKDPGDVLGVREERGIININAGVLRLTFRDALRRLDSDIEFIAFEGDVDVLEIWKIGP
jgi:hypothetical protein